MPRPKKYNKSLKQLIKESNKRPTDNQILYHRIMTLPKFNIKKLLKIKRQLAQRNLDKGVDQ